MNTSDKKKIPILLGLLALLFLSAFFNYTRTPNVSPALVASSNQRARVPAKTEQLPSIAMLQQNPEQVEDVQRNLFQFGSEIGAGTDGEEVEPDETQIVDETTPALPDVRYLGFYQEKNSPGARLGAISNGGKIFVGGVGDILASKYQVLQIENGWIVLRVLDEKKIVRFSLGKDIPPVELKRWTAPQTPAVSNLQEH